jgi:Fe-S-cluster containining protein
MPIRSETDDSLCQRCGLCCDGTLFRTGPLTSAEVDPCRRLGLNVITRQDGAVAFQQPCAALAGGRCGIYAERPQVCHDFKCLLLIALEADEVSLEAAADIVRRTKAAVRRVADRSGERADDLRPAIAERDGLFRHYFRPPRDR